MVSLISCCGVFSRTQRHYVWRGEERGREAGGGGNRFFFVIVKVACS